MARKPRPWYNRTTDSWCVTMHGKRINLAKGKASDREAYQKFLEITGEPTRVIELCKTVAEFRDEFLDDCRLRLRPLTVEFYVRHLGSFCLHCGKLPMLVVENEHVRKWLAQSDWNDTTRHSAAAAVKRLFSWAKSEGKIPVNPIADLKKPSSRRREDIPDDAIVKTMLENISPELRKLFRFIHATGCRVGEARMLEARWVNLEANAAVIPASMHKTGGRSNKPRIIPLNSAAIDIVKPLIEKNSRGPIFLNGRGTPWSRFAVNHAMRRLRERTGLGREASPSGLRHLWTTDALRDGTPTKVVATILGHSSTKMVDQYAHTSDDLRHLVSVAEKVRPSD